MFITIQTQPFDDSLTYHWPLPSQYTFGNQTLIVDPHLSLIVTGNGGGSVEMGEDGSCIGEAEQAFYYSFILFFIFIMRKARREEIEMSR